MNNTILNTESVMSNLPKCTICGEPAIAIIRNYMRQETENGGYKFSSIGEPEWRCKNHNESEMYEKKQHE